MDTDFSFEYIKSTVATGKVKNNLKECISSRTKNTLVEIAKKYGITNISKLRKAELCDELEKTILERLGSTIQEMTAEQKDCFNLISENEMLAIGELKLNYTYLVKKGLAYVFSSKGQYKIVVPEELREIVENMFEENPLFEKYIKGGLSLYGFVEIAFLAKLLSKLKEKKELEKEFKEYVNKKAALTNDFIIIDGSLVDKSLCEDEYKGLNKLKSIIKGEPIFKPTLEQIQAYAQDGYYEVTSGIKKLYDFATTYVTGNRSDAEKIVGLIINEHRRATSYAIERYTSKFVANGYRFPNIKVEAKVVTLLVDVIDNVRLWAYRGYTTAEKKKLVRSEKLKAAKRPLAPITSSKINRNDPCPCGSGKKYKKCCGK